LAGGGEDEEIQRTLAAAKQRVAEEEARQRAALAKAEEKAAANLRYANKLIDGGMRDKGIERLREIVRDYPGTPSAAEAKKQLSEMGER
jgi:hypothetical protein